METEKMTLSQATEMRKDLLIARDLLIRAHKTCPCTVETLTEINNFVARTSKYLDKVDAGTNPIHGS